MPAEVPDEVENMLPDPRAAMTSLLPIDEISAFNQICYEEHDQKNEEE